MKAKLITLCLLSIVLLLAAFAPAFQGPTVFSGDLRVTRDTFVNRDLDVDRNLNVDGKVTIDGLTNLTPQSLTITGSFIITPTSSFVNLDPPFEITSSTTLPIATSGISAGTLLVLRNNHITDTINLDGTGGSVECTGNIALEPSDVLTLVFNGTAWNCIANFDN